MFSSLPAGWLVLLGIEPRALHMLSKSSVPEVYPQHGGEGGEEEADCIFYVRAEEDGLGRFVHPR